MLQPQIAPEVFTLFDATDFIASVAGLVLAVVAIWLAQAHKRDADTVNRNTSDLLIEIRSESKAVSTAVMAELQAYGSSMRETIARNQLTAQTYSPVIASDVDVRQPKP